MIKLLFPIPKSVVVALSGGVDSMAVCDFLRRKHTVTAAFFHHGTSNSDAAQPVVEQYCNDHGIKLIIGRMTSERESKQSPEEFWRINRYEFFDSIDVTLGPIVTAHHLDDSVETYLFSSLHGTPKVIPTHRNRVIRPFLTTPKMEFVEWCVRHTVAWADDTSNTDPKYMRNYIRHQLMPHALKVNPGLPKLVSKITEKRLHDCLDKMTDDSVELNF